VFIGGKFDGGKKRSQVYHPFITQFKISENNGTELAIVHSANESRRV
jgi:hypothetical protein